MCYMNITKYSYLIQSLLALYRFNRQGRPQLILSDNQLGADHLITPRGVSYEFTTFHREFTKVYIVQLCFNRSKTGFVSPCRRSGLESIGQIYFIFTMHVP